MALPSGPSLPWLLFSIACALSLLGAGHLAASYTCVQTEFMVLLVALLSCSNWRILACWGAAASPAQCLSRELKSTPPCPACNQVSRLCQAAHGCSASPVRLLQHRLRIAPAGGDRLAASPPRPGKPAGVMTLPRSGRDVAALPARCPFSELTTSPPPPVRRPAGECCGSEYCSSSQPRRAARSAGTSAGS